MKLSILLPLFIVVVSAIPTPPGDWKGDPRDDPKYGCNGFESFVGMCGRHTERAAQREPYLPDMAEALEKSEGPRKPIIHESPAVSGQVL